VETKNSPNLNNGKSSHQINGFSAKVKRKC
jgi:hypothetical protein